MLTQNQRMDFLNLFKKKKESVVPGKEGMKEEEKEPRDFDRENGEIGDQQQQDTSSFDFVRDKDASEQSADRSDNI